MASPPSSTNQFTRALELTHMYIPDVTQRQRLEAEQYLMALRATADGLNLAFHIVSNEPVHEVRCFWAFNTIMHHLPSLACSINAAQAEELYRTLFSFIYRFFFSSAAPAVQQRQPLDYLANKHAQMMVAGLQEFFPTRWCSFFDDAFELLERSGTLPHVADAVTVYVLRLFEYIDERVVSVRSRGDRGREQRARDMELKDAMREQVMPRAVATWYNILCSCRIHAPEIARICLCVVQTYIEWVDVALFITAEWINLLYFLVTTPAVRGAACECIYSLVEKKQLPVVKMESLRILNVVDALPRIASLLQVPPETEEDANFLEVVARLMCSVAEQFLALYENVTAVAEQTNIHNGNNPNNNNNNNNSSSNMGGGEVGGKCSGTKSKELQLQQSGNLPVECLDAVSAALDTVSGHLLQLLSVINSDVSDTLLPFVQAYTKSAALREKQAVQLLLILYDQTIIRGVATKEDLMWLDDVIDRRKQMHNLMRLLFRRYPTVVQQHMQAVIQRSAGGGDLSSNAMAIGGTSAEQMPLSQQHGQVRSVNCGDSGEGNGCDPAEVEAALRYFYELGESIRMEKLRDASNEFAQLLCVVLSSECIARCPCAVVHLSYFEVLDRYYTFFIYHKEYIPLLLQRLLLSPHGVTNRHPRVRARICYLFGHLVQLLKGNLMPHKQDILQALRVAFTSGVLLPSDRCELYEATGNLLSVMPPLPTSAGTAAPAGDAVGDGETMIVQVMQAVAQNLRDTSVSSLSSVAATVTGVAVGAGGDSACAEAVADAVSYLSALAKGLRGGSSSGGGDASGGSSCNSNAGPADTIAAAMFYDITGDVMAALSAWRVSASVRDRVSQYFTQMVHTLPFESMLVYFPSYVSDALACMEAIPELTKLLRLLNQFVHRSGVRVVPVLARVLPLLLQKVAAVGELSLSQMDMGVVSESTRERREVYRQLFCVLQGAAQAGCVAVIVTLPPAELRALLSQLFAAVHLPGEVELSKLALQIMTKLTVCTTTTTTTTTSSSTSRTIDGVTNDNCIVNSSGVCSNNFKEASLAGAGVGSENSVVVDGGGGGGGNSVGGEDLVLFMLNELVPALLQRFLSPTFDLKDAKNFLLIGEAGLLLKALMDRLGPGNPSLCVLLYNTLQPLVGAEEATGLVTALQKEPRFTTEMKVRFRNMLQVAKERRDVTSIAT
ncbi:tRNA exportin [Trypanosoma grayi]|uniref:tRNA exportin n=1 Tax=Trypanosoma grayi TaxID=71804 RepID=UPI0004F3FD24|nr:tRNA exportin [Trypanosoma grayi]KEG07542.1 tRNA exportin [Trypanosoma grayi]